MKKILINTLIIFLLTSIFHFLYNILKIPILRIFLPINESIFEHIKLLFSANIIFSLFTKDKNKYLKALIRALLSCTILLIIYLPIFLNFKEILPLTLLILFISILLSELITSKIKKNSNNLNYLSIFLILIIYFTFLCLTDNPPQNFLFKDFSK